ncbi:MAG: YggS family pyridoxal phosphate-dependent enzyme [Bacteroidetes bacterium]|nr:MAG: YggS family pyridoxal phosphate-dependent enzyme [Bacteroidota bacterium]
MSAVDFLSVIQARIAEVAARAGREPGSVRLIAVSKTRPVEQIREVFDAGQMDFGENRVQEMQEKQPLLPQARWHLIGSLQRNKVKYMASYVHLIHSVDSDRLLEEINRQAEKAGREINCLLQIHISDEESKSGMSPEEAADILQRIESFPHVRISGLMGMAALTEDQDLIRSQFRGLRLLAGQLSQVVHPRISMQELSMGMSGDFEIAIEEGATLVRIGSAVFGSR